LGIYPKDCDIGYSIYNGILCSHEEEQNVIICWYMDGIGEHHSERLAWPKRPKIICSPSYVDIRSRANTTRGLDFEHTIKARAHKGGVRIGKMAKKLASICCPQCRETKADTLKATEANRRRGPGTREKVRSKRINLEGNIHAQEINVSQLPV
jgi:hypothetical protein